MITAVKGRLRAMGAWTPDRVLLGSSNLLTPKSTTYSQDLNPLATSSSRSALVTLFRRTLLLAAPLCLNGCWLLGTPQGSATTPPAPLVPIRTLTGHSSIQERPEYQAAVKAFSSGDTVAARRSLEALSHAAGLSAADKAFLDHQLAICDGKSPHTKPDATQTKADATAPISRAGKPVTGTGDCGPRALVLVAKELGVKADLSTLTKAAGTNADGTTLEGLVRAAKSLGLKAEGVQADRDALAQLPTLAIAWWEGNHFVAVLKISENVFTGEVSATIHDPNEKEAKSVPLDKLLAQSGGILLVLKK